MSYLTEEEMQHIEATVANQEGQKYPRSSQAVLCGFFGDKKTWQKFCQTKTWIRRTKDCVYFINGERWMHFETNTIGSLRGCRFYKLKVPRSIQKEMFMSYIYPLCYHYCCDIEFY